MNTPPPSIPRGHVPEQKKLQRSLSSRHIQLIAISGAIGTGLFLGSGKTISLAGPSIIFVYMTIGFFLFFVMRAMGELLLSDLRYRSFTDFTSDLLGPWAGYFTGWTYWFCWVVIGIADVLAIAQYTHFWWKDLPGWIPALAVIAVLMTLNLMSVRLFGEIEFWFSMVKIITICALIIVGTRRQAEDSAIARRSTASNVTEFKVLSNTVKRGRQRHQNKGVGYI